MGWWEDCCDENNGCDRIVITGMVVLRLVEMGE